MIATVSGEQFVYRPIGIIRTENTIPDKTPIQPVYAADREGRAEIFSEVVEGLRDIEKFSHLYLIYHFHRAGEPRLIVQPFLEDVEHGIFATRAPVRPNAIGFSVVELIRREGATLYFRGADILDGTPLLDIKPYIARFDHIALSRNGWQDGVDEQTAKRKGGRKE
ncbi:MAG TPA: tRNA (N6-threonylcarbamoyladenosine(37)-N6)-methyltransferase TrmO [bacterium]|nr:tRNA (N6-threonylcarbamoyladenosine(37)-N6)-methyltransferase TrmO [bacterium]